jgi:hypothetical protein
LIFIGGSEEMLQEAPEAFCTQDKIPDKDGGQDAEGPAAAAALIPVRAKYAPPPFDPFSAAVFIIAVQETMQNQKTCPSTMWTGVVFQGLLKTSEFGG